MPYWVASDLANYFPEPVPGTPLVTPTSYPVNLGQLASYVYLVSAQFDAAAARAGYLIPIATTASAGYAYTTEVVRWGVLAAVMEQVYVGPDDEGVRWRKMFDTAIDNIRSGRQEIPGAPLDPSATGRLLPAWNQNPAPIVRTTDEAVSGVDPGPLW